MTTKPTQRKPAAEPAEEPTAPPEPKASEQEPPAASTVTKTKNGVEFGGNTYTQANAVRLGLISPDQSD